MKQMSMRQERVAEQIRETLSLSLSRGGFKHPSIDSFITFPHVWVSPDLRNARVYFSTLDKRSDAEIKELWTALNLEAYLFQEHIASFNRKNTPKIKFVLDSAGEKTNRIEELFAKVMTEQNSNQENA